MQFTFTTCLVARKILKDFNVLPIERAL